MYTGTDGKYTKTERSFDTNVSDPFASMTVSETRRVFGNVVNNNNNNNNFYRYAPDASGSSKRTGGGTDIFDKHDELLVKICGGGGGAGPSDGPPPAGPRASAETRRYPAVPSASGNRGAAGPRVAPSLAAAAAPRPPVSPAGTDRCACRSRDTTSPEHSENRTVSDETLVYLELEPEHYVFHYVCKFCGRVNKQNRMAAKTAAQRTRIPQANRTTRPMSIAVNGSAAARRPNALAAKSVDASQHLGSMSPGYEPAAQRYLAAKGIGKNDDRLRYRSGPVHATTNYGSAGSAGHAVSKKPAENVGTFAVYRRERNMFEEIFQRPAAVQTRPTTGAAGPSGASRYDDAARKLEPKTVTGGGESNAAAAAAAASSTDDEHKKRMYGVGGDDLVLVSHGNKYLHVERFVTTPSDASVVSYKKCPEPNCAAVYKMTIVDGLCVRSVNTLGLRHNHPLESSSGTSFYWSSPEAV